MRTSPTPLVPAQAGIQGPELDQDLGPTLKFIPDLIGDGDERTT